MMYDEIDTYLDNEAGLMWSAGPLLEDCFNVKNYNYADTLMEVDLINSGYGLNGFFDWRLPTIDELKRLYSIYSVPSEPEHYMHYRSSNRPRPDIASHYSLGFDDGKVMGTGVLVKLPIIIVREM